MDKKVVIGLSVGAVALGALGIYGKRQYDMFMNDLFFEYDKSSVKVKKATIDDVSIEMNFIIDNRGKMNIDCKDFRMRVLTQGKEVTKIDRTGEFKIVPNSKAPIPIVVRLNPKRLITETLKGINILQWKDIPLTFKGSIKVRKLGIWIPIPFVVTYKLNDFV